jgi:hypothetical protein
MMTNTTLDKEQRSKLIADIGGIAAAFDHHILHADYRRDAPVLTKVVSARRALDRLLFLLSPKPPAPRALNAPSSAMENAEAYARWLSEQWAPISAQLTGHVPVRLLQDADQRLGALPGQFANADPKHRYKNNKFSARYREENAQ